MVELVHSPRGQRGPTIVTAGWTTQVHRHVTRDRSKISKIKLQRYVMYDNGKWGHVTFYIIIILYLNCSFIDPESRWTLSSLFSIASAFVEKHCNDQVLLHTRELREHSWVKQIAQLSTELRYTCRKTLNELSSWWFSRSCHHPNLPPESSSSVLADNEAQASCIG